MALYLDAASEVWREWVINYDFSHQMKLSAQLNTSTGKAQTSFRGWLWKYLPINGGNYSEVAGAPGKTFAPANGFGVYRPGNFFSCRSLLKHGGHGSGRAWPEPATGPRSVASPPVLRWCRRKSSRRGFHKERTETPVEFANLLGDPLSAKTWSTLLYITNGPGLMESVNDAENAGIVCRDYGEEVARVFCHAAQPEQLQLNTRSLSPTHALDQARVRF